MEMSHHPRTGVRLAILVLIAAGVYFLGLFVQQSLRYYQLTQEVKAAQERVERKRRGVERLKARLEKIRANQPLLAKELGYREEGERVAFPVRTTAEGPVESPAEPTTEDLADLPAWQQWFRLIFTPPPPVAP